jgi:hypothetical protein
MRTAFYMPVILVTSLAAVASTSRSSLAEAAADECLTKPGASAPQGSHWFYRVDRANNNRHCWYLGSEGAKPRATKQQAEAPLRSRVRPTSRPEPAAAESSAVEIADAEGAQGAVAPAPAVASAAPVPAVPPPSGPGVTTENDNSAAVEIAARWHALPRSADATAHGATPVGNNYAEERAPAQSEAEMPPVWPILTPDDAAEPAGSPVSLEYVLALLVGALALAAAIARWVFMRAARGRDRADRRHPLPHHVNVTRPRQPIREHAIADAMTFAPPSVRRSAAALRRDDVAGERPQLRKDARVESREAPLDKPSDPAHDLEASLQRLLQAWQRAAA